jgi:hypothetical protein
VQAEPQKLARLKAEIAAEYPMTSLLDMLKEADLRLGFTEAFGTSTLYETMDRRSLKTRLLLCLHGMGTNTGLKRMNVAHSGISYRDLLYTRNRFINPDRLRFAFCRLLGFELLPRLKNIQSQRLYRPAVGMGGAWPRLVPVLSSPIDWTLTRQQYDQMVKYTTALRLGPRRQTRSCAASPGATYSTPPIGLSADWARR